MPNDTILVIGEGSSDDYEEVVVGDFNRVIVRDIDPTSGDRLGDREADLIVLTTSVSSEVMQRILEPMTAIGGEIIHLY